MLSHPTIPGHARDLQVLESAARTLKIRLHVAPARGPGEFAGALAEAAKKRCGAVVILSASVYHAHRVVLAALALESRLPSLATWDDYPRSGGLMSYGPDIPEAFRRAAVYVAKILDGAKPAELPVEQPTKLHLVINLGTSLALGLVIPQSVRLRADEVIE